MYQNRWYPVTMWLKHASHPGRVLYIGETFVVYDHIESIGPVRIVIKRNLRIRGCATLMHNDPLDICTSRYTFCQYLLLTWIIMTAPTRDQESPNRLAQFLGGIWRLSNDMLAEQADQKSQREDRRSHEVVLLCNNEKQNKA
jgi:hypothetical protein